MDREMRSVLLQLALTSNGSTSSLDADRGGGSAQHHEHAVLVGRLRLGDAPAEHFRDLYNAATNLAERESVLEAAKARRDSISWSTPAATVMQTRDELYKWIVANCEGLDRREAAIRSCTGKTFVWSARLAHGREPDYGREPRDSNGLTRAERRRRVRELAAEKMSAASIATALRVSYSTVLRDLGRRKDGSTDP